MVLQTPDCLHHNGRALEANAAEALAAYFAAQVLACGRFPPAPVKESQRRYQSVWETRNDRLYLMKFDPLSPAVAADTPYSLTRFGADDILAEWFTGSIYVDDAKVDIHEDDLDPLRQRPIVALEFDRGLFGLVRLLPGTQSKHNINHSNAGY